MRHVGCLMSLALLASGCGPSSDGGGGGDGGSKADGGGALSGITAVVVAPASVMLTTTGGVAATQAFTATGTFAGGRVTDVTALCAWSLGDAGLGTIAGGQYTSVTDRGGSTLVTAACGAVSGTAMLTLRYESVRVSTSGGSTAPADAPTKFTSTTVDPSLAPLLVYPLDGALVPKNLGQMQIQWRKSVGPADLFEVALTSPTVSIKVYTNALRALGGVYAIEPAEWTALASSTAGDTVTIVVRAVLTADPSKLGVSTPVRLSIGKDAVNGGIYYWSATGATTQEGIIRHRFGDLTPPAPFYTKADGNALFNDGRTDHCVACHALSRDGTKMAITYNGGDGPASVLNVMDKTALLAVNRVAWNFASLNPDGTRMVTAKGGALRIYDITAGPTNGQVVGGVEIPGGGQGTHPDWSADGHAITWTKKGNAGSDWDYIGGSIYVTNDSTGTFNTSTAIVPSAGENNYYPSFSPDGEWVLFNRATGTSYNNGNAELWVVRSSGGTPIKLTAASGAAGSANSWPRWSPFVQRNGPNGKLLYLTFSSQRDYGIELVGLNKPQIWMAAFDPSLATAGSDPSSVPFWLPFQDMTTNNHIAQWATQIIGID